MSSTGASVPIPPNNDPSDALGVAVAGASVAAAAFFTELRISSALIEPDVRLKSKVFESSPELAAGNLS